MRCDCDGYFILQLHVREFYNTVAPIKHMTTCHRFLVERLLLNSDVDDNSRCL